MIRKKDKGEGMGCGGKMENKEGEEAREGRKESDREGKGGRTDL